MPYGLCVASGVVAGVISLMALVHTETPRSTPSADIAAGTTWAVPTEVTLHHNANLMFDTARPQVSRSSAPAPLPGVTLPLGQRVRVTLAPMNGVASEWRTGELVGCDAEWIQLRYASGNDVFINRAMVEFIEVY